MISPELLLVLAILVIAGIGGVLWYAGSPRTAFQALEVGGLFTSDAPKGEEKESLIGTSTGETSSGSPECNERKGASLVLETEDAESLIEVSPSSLNPDSVDQGNMKEVPEGLTRVISPIIERLPPLAENVHDVSQSSYEVVLNDELMSGLRNGSFEMMNSKEVADGFRLNVIDGDNQVVGQGSVMEIGDLGSLAAGTFQIVSFAVGQAHLARISNRLDSLQDQTEEIINLLKEERRGDLRGMIQYMKNLVPTLKHKPLSPEEVKTYRQKLEDIELGALQISETVKSELERKEQSVYDEDPSSFEFLYRLNKNKDDLMESLEGYSRALQSYQMALWVRTMAAELMGYLPIDQSQVRKRRTNLEETIGESLGRHRELTRVLSSKATRLEGTVARGKTEVEVQREALHYVQDRSSQLKDGFEELRSVTKEGGAVGGERKEVFSGRNARLLVSETSGGKYKAHLLE